ncbi:MAG: hypothetical protein QGG36_02205, partial [Pirellulaceae bacterium]|nr:hypothetical protein [Pirellulaceae bacterium]
TQFEESLADNSLCQVFWAAAAVTAAGLQFMLPNQPVETSMTLLLPPGEYPAVFWYSLRGLDLFALAGWTFMGVWAWRRGQSPWWAAPMIVLFLLGTETMARSSLVYGIEIGMRLAFGEAA